MASAAAIFACGKPSQFFHADQPDSITVRFLKSGRRHILKQRDMRIIKGHVSETGYARKKLIINLPRKSNSVGTLAATSDLSSTGETSPADVVRKFYKCINAKDLKKLEEFIAKNCLLEDSFFPYQIRGKKEVMGFFGQLVESLGENAQFRIGHICEGDELIATVDWHMEWEGDQIPFSRGCSIFQFSKEDDRLVIRKAQIITEPPIKPGKLAMALLKILTSLFDNFPKAAKWFLKSPEHILKAILTVYNLFLAPIVNPVLAFYTTLWKLTVRLFGYVISILHIISKFLGQEPSHDKRSLDQTPTKDDPTSDDTNKIETE